jgi:hypothetical protein
VALLHAGPVPAAGRTNPCEAPGGAGLVPPLRCGAGI